MKKMLSLFLSILISFSCFGVIYAEDEIKADKVEVPKEVIDIIKGISTEENGFLNSIQSAVKVISSGGSVFSTYNAINIFLKSIGVVTDPTQSKLDDIVNKLDDINTSILQMNRELDDIASMLEKNFAEVDLDFEDLKVRTDKQNVNAFISNYDDVMTRRMSNFGNTIYTKMMSFFENTDDFVIPVSYVENKNNIEIDDDVIEDIVNEINDSSNKKVEIAINGAFESKAWDIENYESNMKEILASYVDGLLSVVDKDTKAADLINSDLYKTGLMEWMLKEVIENNELSPTPVVDYDSDEDVCEKWLSVVYGDDLLDNLKTVFAENVYQAKTEEFFKEICSEGEGTTSHYANLAADEFNKYCRNVVDQSASPYLNELDILTKIYLFQGETKDLIEQLRTYYLGTLTKYASFYLSVIKASRLPNFADYVNLYCDTVKTISEDFDKFIVIDNDGKILDNYCYITNCPLAVEGETLHQKMEITHEQSRNRFFGTYYDEYLGYKSEPWILSISNSNIVNSEDMLKLSIMYRYLRKDNETFNGYLDKYIDYLGTANENILSSSNTIPDASKYITNYEGTKSFNLSEKIELNVYSVGWSTYFPQTMLTKKVNDGKDSDIVDSGFLIHDSAVSDTFNTNNLTLTKNDKLKSRALYAKHSSAWFYDEMAMFSNDNYIHYSTVDDNHQKVASTPDEKTYHTTNENSFSGFYVIKKLDDNFSDLSFAYPAFNMLTNDSELPINNRPDGFAGESNKTYSISYEKASCNDNKLSDEEIKVDIIDYINSQKAKDAMVEYNQSRLSKLSTIDKYNGGVIDYQIDDDNLKKIIDTLSKFKCKDYGSNVVKKLSKDGMSYKYRLKGDNNVLVTLPSEKANVSLKLVISYMPIFQIIKNGDEYGFTVKDGYIVEPYLVWDNNKVLVDDEVITLLGLSFNVKIPTLDDYGNKRYASISHYSNYQDLWEPKEIIDGNRKGDWIYFTVNSFSPFVVNKYYNPIVPYVPVNTCVK